MFRLVVFMAALLIGSATVAVTVDGSVKVDAAVTNCSKGVSGTYAWAYCSSTNGNPPYTTKFVIVATCTRPWILGGGSYDNAGNWMVAGGGYGSHFYCAANYNAGNPRILFS